MSFLPAQQECGRKWTALQMPQSVHRQLWLTVHAAHESSPLFCRIERWCWSESCCSRRCISSSCWNQAQQESPSVRRAHLWRKKSLFKASHFYCNCKCFPNNILHVYCSFFTVLIGSLYIYILGDPKVIAIN